MKLALASISGLAAAVLLYLVIGVIMLHNKEQKHDSAVIKSITTITVHCKDGSVYEITTDSEEEFRCEWKQLVFNR